jgi:peptidoglycan/LPS O-acetylase OafA/YrhL
MKRLYEMDFARTMCMIGIIYCHFAEYISLTNDQVNWKFILFNHALSGGFVAAFFMISGACIYANNQTISKKYCSKRFLSIFPIFYLVYIACAFYYKYFSQGVNWHIVFTIIGMDGYFSYRMQTYYLVGEWFLGAIIILYILYPLLLRLINKFEYVTHVVIACLIIFMTCDYAFFHRFFVIPQNTNLIYCITCFWCGMVFMKYRIQMIKFMKWICIPMLIIGFAIPYVGISNIVVGCSELFILLFCGKFICKNSILIKMICFFSSISYAVLLVHHWISTEIIKQANRYNFFNNENVILLFVITIVFVYFISFVFWWINKYMVKALSKLV